MQKDWHAALWAWGLASLLAGCTLPKALPLPVEKAPQSMGSLAISVQLPRQAQALVSNTQSLKLLLRNTSLLGPDMTATVNGSGPQTILFNQLPAGTGYTLYGGAYSGANATGT